MTPIEADTSAKSAKVSVAHVITGLYTGGAEHSALKLVQGLPRDQFQHFVLSLLTEGELTPEFRAAGAEVVSLGLGLGEFRLRSVFTARRTLRRWRPDLIQGWMYHGSLLASLAGFGIAPVAWNIRQCMYDLKLERPTTRKVFKLLKYLSWQPNAIVYNSSLSQNQHAALGFRNDAGLLIDNGVDLERFNPSQADGRLHRLLALDPQTPLLGHIGRWHHLKDHATLLSAARTVLEQVPSAHLVLIGPGVAASNPAVETTLTAMHWPEALSGRVHLLGERHDIPQCLSEFTILINSSIVEGSPNVVLEAMASGVPCIATNVGDTGRLLGSDGILVAPQSPRAIAEAAIDLLLAPERRHQLALAARSRAGNRFALTESLAKYQELYVNRLSLRRAELAPPSN